MTANADVFKVLVRAVGRWATKQADDPADPEYLRHLAAALQPLTGEAPTVPADPAEVEQWRTRAAEYFAGAEQARAELAALRTERDDLQHALAAARAARDTATNQLKQLQAELAEAHRDADSWRERSDGWQGDANQYGAERDDARRERDQALELLGRLVDAVTTQWAPDGDIPAQVTRAVDLVQAASDQLNERYDTGHHIHQYAQLPNGRYGPCECGKPYPRTATKTGLTTAKGDAA